MVIALLEWPATFTTHVQCIPSQSMSFTGECSDDGLRLDVVLVSVILQVQVHLATSSLLDQLSRHLTVPVTQAHIGN